MKRNLSEIKTNKKWYLIIPIIIILIAMWVIVYTFYPFTYQIGRVSDEVWADSQTFSIDNTIQLEKNPTKDFVVLNLADVQFSNISLFNGDFVKAKNLITRLVADKNPDLITLTGDNIAGGVNYMVLQELTRFIDSFNIPWAPVMGNHDDDGSGDYNWVADIFLTANNCIFKKGFSELGVGNYVVAIMQDSEIVQAIIMMDTHSTHIWEKQKNWYSWVINGLNAVAGKAVETTLMFHIPLVEYDNAWDYWESQNFDESIGSGVKNESVCCDYTNNGFFDLIKTLGSTKNVICGHDHINNYSIFYEGVRLTYAVKSSEASYFYDEIMGGTVLSISASGVGIEQYMLKA